MKSRKMISTIMLTVISIGSVFAIANKNFDSKKTEPVEAASSISDTVYLELNSSRWGEANAYYRIRYWGGSNPSPNEGILFNDGQPASGNVVISATWDTSSTHVTIERWEDASRIKIWNWWDWFKDGDGGHSFTPGSYNYFLNDDWYSCQSRLVYENTGFSYFGNMNNWDNVYAYVFHYSYSGIRSLGNWPGTEMTNSSDITFDGKTGLYRISFTKVLGTMVIFNNGLTGESERKTNHLSLLNDGYYNTYYNDTGDGERGAAAEFVYNLNVARKAVVAAGDIKEESICGISTGTAASLATTYNALSSTSKGFVDSATIHTYKDQGSSGADTDVSVSAIMQQLSNIGETPLSTFFVPTRKENHFGLTFISIVSITVLLYFGVRYLIKKNSI